MKKIISLCFLALLMIANGFTYAANDSQVDVNKKNVVTFYDELINQKDFDSASRFMGDRYVQHNPLAADGAEGLRGYIQYLRANYPDSHSEIKRVVAEGDYVILHVHSVLQKNTKGRAIIDIFKLENGKIVEHWDVIQDIPEKSANENGMF